MHFALWLRADRGGLRPESRGTRPPVVPCRHHAPQGGDAGHEVYAAIACTRQRRCRYTAATKRYTAHSALCVPPAASKNCTTRAASDLPAWQQVHRCRASVRQWHSSVCAFSATAPPCALTCAAGSGCQGGLRHHGYGRGRVAQGPGRHLPHGGLTGAVVELAFGGWRCVALPLRRVLMVHSQRAWFRSGMLWAAASNRGPGFLTCFQTQHVE